MISEKVIRLIVLRAMLEASPLHTFKPLTLCGVWQVR